MDFKITTGMIIGLTSLLVIGYIIGLILWLVLLFDNNVDLQVVTNDSMSFSTSKSYKRPTT